MCKSYQLTQICYCLKSKTMFDFRSYVNTVWQYSVTIRYKVLCKYTYKVSFLLYNS